MLNGQHRTDEDTVIDIDLDTIQVLQLAVYIIYNDTGPKSAGVRLTVTRLSGSKDRYILFDACMRAFTKRGAGPKYTPSFKLRPAQKSDREFGSLSKHLKFKNLHTFYFNTDANSAELRKSLKQLLHSFQQQSGRPPSSELYEFNECMSRFMGTLQRQASLPPKARYGMRDWLVKYLPPAPKPSSTAASSHNDSSDLLNMIALSSTQATPAPAILGPSAPQIQPFDDPTLLPTSLKGCATTPTPKNPLSSATTSIPIASSTGVQVREIAEIDIASFFRITFAIFFLKNRPDTDSSGLKLTVRRLDGSTAYYLLTDARLKEYLMKGGKLGPRSSFRLLAVPSSHPALGKVSDQLRVMKLRKFTLKFDVNAALRDGLATILKECVKQHGNQMPRTPDELITHISRVSDMLVTLTTLDTEMHEAYKVKFVTWLRLELSTGGSASPSPLIHPTPTPPLSSLPSPQPTLTSNTMPLTPTFAHLSTGEAFLAAAYGPPPPKPIAEEPYANLDVDTIETIHFEAYWLGMTWTKEKRTGVRITVSRINGTTDHYLSEVPNVVRAAFNFLVSPGFPVRRVDGRTHDAFNNALFSEDHFFTFARHDFNTDENAPVTRVRLMKLLKKFSPDPSGILPERGNAVDRICSFARTLSADVGVKHPRLKDLGGWLSERYQLQPGSQPPSSSSSPSSSRASLDSISAATSSSSSPNIPTAPVKSFADSIPTDDICFEELSYISVSAFQRSDIHQDLPFLHGIHIAVEYHKKPGQTFYYLHYTASRNTSASPGIRTRLTDLDLPLTSNDTIAIFTATFSHERKEASLLRSRLREIFKTCTPNSNLPTFYENICFLTSQIAIAGFPLATSDQKIISK